MENNEKRTVCALNMCCGCMACLETCHKSAIEIIDSLNAYNAVKNDNCVNCGLCEKVCPQINSPRFMKPVAWKQGWAKDDYVHMQSSSGGFATAISKAFIRADGIVCSCIFRDGIFGFKFADNLHALEGFPGSKYVKSNPIGVYNQIKKYLSDKRSVLFIGLPCQVAGVKNFVGENLQNGLFTMDIICHGTPSPAVLKKFLKEHGVELDTLKEIGFRHNNRFALNYDGKYIVPNGNVDSYTIAFHHSYSYTNNCYECKYARTDRISDVTLGDAWGSSLPELNNGKGVSLALCQTDKGLQLLKMADITTFDINLDIAISNNAQLNKPSPKPSNWLSFFNDMKEGNSMDKLVRKYIFKAYFRQVVKYLCLQLRIIKRGGVIYQISYKE